MKKLAFILKTTFIIITLLALSAVSANAQAIYDQGAELFDLNLYREALPYFQKAYQDLQHIRCAIAESISNEVLSLPIGPHMTLEQAKYIADTLNEFRIE